MGNRAVITTKENFDHNGVGVYLHWNGGRDSVEAFLKYCELKGYRTPDTDCYGWARLVQVIANFFEGGLSVGIDVVDCLDCNNYDNGVYIIEGWKIVDRKFHDGAEQSGYDINEMMIAIDSCMPEHEQLGREFLTAPVVKPEELKVGDWVAYTDWNGKITKAEIVGIGKDEMVNGHNVLGIPYIDKFNSSNPAHNPNNYLFSGKEYQSRVYRKLG